MRLIIGLLGALALTFAPLQAQDDALRFEPAGDWVIQQADESCVLGRNFSSSDQVAGIRIERQAPGPYFRISVLSPGFEKANPAIRVRFTPDRYAEVPDFLGHGTTGEYFVLTFTDSTFPNMRGQVRPFIDWSTDEERLREQSITGLEIPQGLNEPVFLATGEMYAPMQALRDCVDALYASWGVDLSALDDSSLPAGADNARELTGLLLRELPQEIRRTLPEQLSVARVIFNPDGHVTRCRITITEWGPDLIARLCAVITEHAQFRSPRNAQGERIAGYSTIFFGGR